MSNYTNIQATQRIADVEMMDTMQWTNATGYDVLQNQLVTVTGATNEGYVFIAAQPIANGATGTVIRKMVVELPKTTDDFTQGQKVLYVPAASYVTTGITTAGTFVVGMAVKAAATSASYVNVALNEGPKAFYVY